MDLYTEHRAKLLATPKLTPLLFGVTTALLLTLALFFLRLFMFSLIQKVVSSNGKQKICSFSFYPLPAL